MKATLDKKTHFSREKERERVKRIKNNDVMCSFFLISNEYSG